MTMKFIPPVNRRSVLTAFGGIVAAGFVPRSPLVAAPAKGLRVIVIGAGVAGLTAGYEIEKQGGEAILLEARKRVGGRAWTLRGGDRVSHIGEDDQIVGFSPNLYLNAGPARIPSHHEQYLGYARELGVPLEVLVNTSRSDYLFDSSQLSGSNRVRLRQVANDLRGHFSELLEKALRSGALDQELTPTVRTKLVDFLKLYGDLASDGSYRGSQRSGLSQLPGSTNEQPIGVPPLTLDALLANQQLSMILFDENILMQATMVQPVGGMDRLPVALAKALRTPPRLGAEVREIRRDGAGGMVVYRDAKTGRDHTVSADYVIITTPLPILARIPNDFSAVVKAAIAGVRYSDAIKIGFESAPFWEADQIYGGISFVGGDTSLVWYPSGQFQQKRQVLLAAYAARAQAEHLAAHSRTEQIELARAAVDRLHPGHGRDLASPVLVHWRRIPFSEGPWIEWDDPGNDRRAADLLNAGDGPFRFAGSHLSAYSGHWQEGAILSAKHAVSLLARPS
jgi:monoamine oxidase